MPQTAQFNIEVDQAASTVGEELVVSVFVDTASQETNTVFARIIYPKDKLQFIDSSFSDSNYPNVVERKVDDNLIKLTSFTTTPYSGREGLFTKLKFRRLTEGEVNLTIQPNSKIHANDGEGTNLADPGKLPVSLSLFTEEAQEPILRKGETLSVVEEKQPVAVAQGQESAGQLFDLTEKGIADYSTFAGYPKVYPPGQRPPEYKTVFGVPLYILLLAFVFFILLLLFIKLLKRKPKIPIQPKSDIQGPTQKPTS